MSSDQPDTRTRILQSTVQLLEEAGSRGARMSDIAARSGLSRQAIYLHFTSRTELLVAATRYLDDELGLGDRLAPSRAAGTGVERLSLYIEFWGHYIPDVYPVAKALLEAQASDEAAAAAWSDRMDAMRDGCRAAIDALHADGRLAPGWTRPAATDALYALLLVPTWEALVVERGWSAKQYVRRMTTLAERAFVSAE